MRAVTVVVGAPCAGKTTHVHRHAAPGDIVIDWDQLAIDAGSPVAHDHEKQYRTVANQRRLDLEHALAETDDVTAWVIRTVPNPADRVPLMQRLRATDLIVIDPGVETCLQRARDTGRHPDVDAVILRWYGYQWGARCYDRTTWQTTKPRTDPRHTAEWRRVRAIVLAAATRCALCGEPIRFDLKRPHPLSPSVDHITPIERGGAWYDLTNLRATHLGCNSRRQARDDAPIHRTSDKY